MCDGKMFNLIETHRAAYALLGKAEDDFNAAADDDDTLEGPMLAACDIHRVIYDFLLATIPTTGEGMMALIRHVDEVAQQQRMKGHPDDGPEILAANLKEVVLFAA